jgi:hypothetical protein
MLQVRALSEYCLLISGRRDAPEGSRPVVIVLVVGAPRTDFRFLIGSGHPLLSAEGRRRANC